MNVDRARAFARAALANLEANRQRIDDLNVYPVPDGDTGTNLTLTVRAIVEALDASQAEGAEAAAKELTRAALMGARGNSGVIFSQIVRGFAEVLGQHAELDGPILAAAFRSAADAAYRAVRRPVEGTMLTVVREMAEEAERPEIRALPKDELLRHVVARGEQALARTPELLPVLADAGVVDAGGAGLLEIVRGLAAAVAGEELPAVAVASEGVPFEAIHHELSEFRYCTVFLVEGEALDGRVLESELERLGDSLLVVGDSSALKVHVHTDDPGAALSLATRVGIVEGIEIANMHRQTTAREARLSSPAVTDGLPALETGLVAVAMGAGNRQLFVDQGATRVIEGGQTMNPSTEEIVDAIERTPATEVIVLPNNKNVVLSAEQARQLSSKPVRVVPTTSVQAGLAAIVVYVASQPAAENETRMLAASESISTGEVTIASRDVVLDGVDVVKGAWLGLVDGAAVASGDDFDFVAGSVVDRLLEGERELLTLLTGAEEPALEKLLGRVAADHPVVDVEVHHGGQPYYPLLLSAE